MQNKDMPAMSHIDKAGTMAITSAELTKREQAAITILAGLVANQFNVSNTNDSLAEKAIDLADKLFDRLEK